MFVSVVDKGFSSILKVFVQVALFSVKVAHQLVALNAYQAIPSHQPSNALELVWLHAQPAATQTPKSANLA